MAGRMAVKMEGRMARRMARPMFSRSIVSSLVSMMSCLTRAHWALLIGCSRTRLVLFLRPVPEQRGDHGMDSSLRRITQPQAADDCLLPAAHGGPFIKGDAKLKLCNLRLNQLFRQPWPIQQEWARWLGEALRRLLFRKINM
ncbi:hypothetical protein EYF80_052573 [Liparis tanakae]|uniref:Uncharacterized protein n=1 Tax=Liparis tanakae TaxID=230148 RepID=A0A4Z2F8C4_9TELE|nr:hypothetical protein EYF80_052573 [Liparis tanakae]